ncbi:uncharacterized protein LOC119076690 [Bradysia coprophila]|uniref:uncharacterized protein LOC119076690 n=1 Tax=Bradysia coprophila TaxID=38358 RepID=UPI00187D787F|nr:uncharacterized protein LOC119076690 [Bradysia coprophila]
MCESTSYSTKFRVADKEAEGCNVFVENRTDSDKESATKSIYSQSAQYKLSHCTELLMEAPYSSKVHASDNGFVMTVVDCYNQHYNLVIRPDDIWMAIMTQFSFYINNNAEEFRSQFINLDGKRELVVAIDGSLRSAPYDLVVTKLTEAIDENLVDKTVKNWILPNFSTTTADDIISCGIVFMATAKKFFEYACCLKCGIPYVTLEGTLADWESILSRLEKLKEYKLDKWYEMLRPILEEFIAAKNNEPNIEFWNRICNHLTGRSGPSYISGWITAFAVFNVEGKWTDHSNDTMARCMYSDLISGPWPLIDIEKIPFGIVAVGVKIIEEPEEYESLLLAGHTGFEVMQDGCTLKPQIGWCIALKLTADEVEKLHETARENKSYGYCALCDMYV